MRYFIRTVWTFCNFSSRDICVFKFRKSKIIFSTSSQKFFLDHWIRGTQLKAIYFRALCTMPSQPSTSAADKTISATQQLAPSENSRSDAKTNQKLNDMDESKIHNELLIKLNLIINIVINTMETDRHVRRTLKFHLHNCKFISNSHLKKARMVTVKTRTYFIKIIWKRLEWSTRQQGLTMILFWTTDIKRLENSKRHTWCRIIIHAKIKTWT